MAKQFQINTASGGTLTTSLVSYYKGEDATDFYGGVNGTDTSVTRDSSNGKRDNGGSYNGTSSYTIANAPNFGSAYTIAFWMKTNFDNTSDGSQRIFIDTTTPRQFLFYYEQGAKKFGWNSGGANVIDPFTYSFGNISGQWHHWAFVWTSTTSWNVYYDGTSIESGTATITTGQPTSIVFGANSAHTGSWYNGAIDELGIWNKAISANELTDLYNGGAGQTMIETSNLNFF